MALQNFVAGALPKVSAVWLNLIDSFYTTLFQSATTAAQARTAIGLGTGDSPTFVAVTANLTGNVTGNASGTAATVTGAAQAAITSVGTLVTGTSVAVGTGSGTATTVGIANLNTTVVGNVGAGEDVLMTYDLPANSLSANKKGVMVSMWGKTANNANAKTLKVYFGSTMLCGLSLTTAQIGAWRVTYTAIRTGASIQNTALLIVECPDSVALAAPKMSHFTLDGVAQVDTAAITIKATGTATADNDVTQEGMLVEFLN